MAVNRYDTPAQAEFINTYVPIPFEEMMKVGMMKQQLVENNDKAADDLLGAVNAIKVAPADEPYYKDKLRGLQTELSKIQSETTPGSYEAKRQILSLRNRMAQDADLREMSQNYGIYTDAMSQWQDATKNNITDPNKADLNRIITDLNAGGKGTLGLRKERGVGLYNKGNYYGNVDTYKAVEQYVNNVDASSFEKEGTTGQWIINNKQGGRTLEALASPFGLSFETVPSKDGKSATYSTVIKDPEGFKYNLLNKDWGQQYIRNAKHALGKSNVDDSVIELATEEAKSEMVKAIKERVTKNTSETIQIDPMFAAEWGEKIKNKVQPLTFPQATVLKGNGIPNVEELHAFSVAADQNIESTKASFEELKKNATSLPVKNEKGETIGYEYRNANGEDITDEMRKRELAVELAANKKQDLENLKTQTRQEAADILTKRLGYKVDPNAEPEMKYKKAAFKDAIKDAVGTAGLPTIVAAFEASRGNLSALNTLGPDIREKVKEAYYKRLDEHDPMTKEVNKLLAERAADKAITIGLTQFGDARANKTMEEAFMSYGVPDVEGDFKGVRVGLNDAYTGDPVAKEEYEKLANDKQPLYKGWTQNVNTGAVEVHYRPYQKKDKDGNYNFAKDVTMPAPGGFVNMLLKENMTTEAEMYVGSELARIGSSPDGVGTVMLKDAKGNNYAVEVTKLSNQERRNLSGSPEYLLRYKEISKADGTPGITRTTYATRNQAGAEILDLGRKINNIPVAQ